MTEMLAKVLSVLANYGTLPVCVLSFFYWIHSEFKKIHRALDKKQDK